VILKEECTVVKFCFELRKAASKMHEMLKTVLVTMPRGEHRIFKDFLNSNWEKFRLKIMSFQIF
jgi:hypothetical protein